MQKLTHENVKLCFVFLMQTMILFLSLSKGLEAKKVILVAMHHTFDEDYTLPNHRVLDNSAVTLFVDCLFFEKKGLLTCSRNKEAVKKVREEVIT